MCTDKAEDSEQIKQISSLKRVKSSAIITNRNTFDSMLDKILDLYMKI